jgi:endonuclease/exonuclease/phosphatase family metal-dependent hydrolase
VDGPGTRCRVVTWNVGWRFGDWQARFAAIAAVLADADPDVVGLQEVWARGPVNAAELLARRLGRHWAWTPSPVPQRRPHRDASFAVGNAVLSRWPVAGVAHADLPALDGAEPDGRRVLLAALDTPAGRLPFFTTHLSAFPGRSGLRCAQARRVAEFVDGHSGDGLPPVVCGDLGARPESDEVRLLEGVLTEPAVPGLALTDVWRWAAPGDRGTTRDPVNPHVAATGEPAARVDYVLVGAPRPGCGIRVEGVGLLGDRPRAGVWPSDHAAVRADLRLVREPG